MIDIHLRATGKIALDNALQAAGLLSDDAETLAPLVCLDRIGTISRVTGYVGGEPVVEVVDGYHANLRLLFEPSAAQVEALFPVTILAPADPFRVWAS
jgi:hypothetical protein